jgi:hypothetical protein
MPGGGWNKGIKNSTGTAFKGKRHSTKSKNLISEKVKLGYSKPKVEKIITTKLCQYGCNNIAKYIFSNGKLCCSPSFNSCPGKRKSFSQSQDHKANAAKSLKTRKELGITKSSRKKAVETMRKNGTYDVLREKMQKHWAENPWNNNLQCPLVEYKQTNLIYQGSFEYNFLEDLENQNGINWLQKNVKRGPSIWYVDPIEEVRRLYISDFLIENTIYEIKSHWTWNKHGKDKDLEMRNKIKLKTCIEQGYNVVLVLNGEEINAATLD